MMRSPAYFAPSLFSLALLAFAHVAHADSTTTTNTGTLTVKLLKVGDSTYDSNAKRPINKVQCGTDKLDLTFRIDNITGTPKYIEAWLGSNCNETTRLDTTSGDPCVAIRSQQPSSSATSILEFKIAASELCDKDGDRNLYFLGVSETESKVAPTVFGKFVVGIDQTAPAAPTKVRGGSGETEIPVKWKVADEDIDHYLIIWDSEASSEGSTSSTAGATATDDDGGTVPEGPKDCSSSVLMADQTVQDNLKLLPDGIDGKLLKGKVESTTLSGDNLGSKLAAVGVVAVDRAGNPSKVSNIACVFVVPTTGFWDDYKANGGTAEEGCACSLPGKSSSPASAWPVALAVFTLVMRARRRKS